MGWGRVPRKLLSSWVYQGRPRGRPCMRWAESIEIDLELAGIPISKWAERKGRGQVKVENNDKETGGARG